jgi:hypothetical protein
MNTPKISPYPIGATGTLVINGGCRITNGNTDNSSNSAELQLKTVQSNIPEQYATFTCVGASSTGYTTINDAGQFCLYTQTIGTDGNIRKIIESTPLKTGTTGPAGLSGAVGDKYFYGSVQAAGVYGNTGSFQNISAQNITVNGTFSLNGSLVLGVQIV